VIESRSFRYQNQEYRLQAEVVSCGEDLCILISGGDRPHIGAAALGVWTGGANNPGRQTATASLISVPGHKEGPLALDAAEMLARILERTVAVTVGIHIEGITPDLITRVEEEFHILVGDLSETLLDL